MCPDADSGGRLLTRDAVLGLARSDLLNFRKLRYRGEEQAIALDAFRPHDRAILTETYALLLELQTLIGATGLAAFTERPAVTGLSNRLRGLGSDARYDDAVASAIHDLRGGAVNALLMELASPLPTTDGHRALSVMTRDVLKLARTLVHDLDPPLRERDLEHRLHSVVDLHRALEHYQDRSALGRVTLTLESDDHAFVAASCAELGTVERVAFNLLHNAAVHSGGPRIEGHLALVGENLRVAIANTVTPEHRARLADFARDPSVLYTEFSTTGSGRGLQIAADLVARAYGVETIRELVDGGYVGSVLTDQAFVGWFHWPIAR